MSKPLTIRPVNAPAVGEAIRSQFLQNLAHNQSAIGELVTRQVMPVQDAEPSTVGGPTQTRTAVSVQIVTERFENPSNSSLYVDVDRWVQVTFDNGDVDVYPQTL